MPFKGAEIGITSMAVSLVLATGTALQWIQRTNSADAHSEEAVGFVRRVRVADAERQPRAVTASRSSNR